MLDVMAALLPGEFLTLDLAAGPGAASKRLLARFPGARSIAVELDPIMLAMGQNDLGDAGGRLRWVEADLTRPEWVEALPEGTVDAVVTTTALHWLPAGDLYRLYRQVHDLLRPTGLFLNGDHFRFGPELATMQRISEAVSDARRAPVLQQRGLDRWRSWFTALEADEEIADLYAERQRRFAWRPIGGPVPGLDFHLAALKDAGFAEAGTIWQNMHNHVLMAVR
jgi:SAM-dependent methyltransferase